MIENRINRFLNVRLFFYLCEKLRQNYRRNKSYPYLSVRHVGQIIRYRRDDSRHTNGLTLKKSLPVDVTRAPPSQVERTATRYIKHAEAEEASIQSGACAKLNPLNFKQEGTGENLKSPKWKSRSPLSVWCLQIFCRILSADQT